jgi:hypothetical protein
LNIKRAIAAGGLAVAATLGVTVASGSAAQAATAAPHTAARAQAPADTYLWTICLYNQASGYYMSKGLYPNFNPLVMNYDACGDTPTLFDVWQITQGGNTLVNHDGDFCLTDQAGGYVFLSPCDSNNAYDRWDFHDAPTGITIVSEGTRWCLTAGSDGSVFTSPCVDNDPWQFWN